MCPCLGISPSTRPPLLTPWEPWCPTVCPPHLSGTQASRSTPPPHTSQGPRGPGPGPSDTPQGPRRRPPLTGSPPSQSSRPPSPSRTPAPLGPQLPSPSPGAPSPLTPEGPGPPSPSPGAAAPSAPPAGPALTARDRPSDGGEEGSGVAHLGKGGGRHTAFTETAALPAAAAVFPQSTPRFINAVTSNAVLGRGEAPGMESPFPFRCLPPPRIATRLVRSGKGRHRAGHRAVQSGSLPRGAPKRIAPPLGRRLRGGTAEGLGVR